MVSVQSFPVVVTSANDTLAILHSDLTIVLLNRNYNLIVSDFLTLPFHSSVEILVLSF